jgi:hypothetical protein
VLERGDEQFIRASFQGYNDTADLERLKTALFGLLGQSSRTPRRRAGLLPGAAACALRQRSRIRVIMTPKAPDSNAPTRMR